MDGQRGTTIMTPPSAAGPARVASRGALTRARLVGRWRGGAMTAAMAVAALALTACGSNPGSSSSTTTTYPQGGGSPGASFRAAVVAGLGAGVVDARGHTVYVLSSGVTKNLRCTSSNGCTAIWPALPLPSGAASARTGAGLRRHLLGSVRVGAATYATYDGWRMYEFSGDTGPAQSGGEGLSSFGGTWHALGADGAPVLAPPPSTTTTYRGY